MNIKLNNLIKELIKIESEGFITQGFKLIQLEGKVALELTTYNKPQELERKIIAVEEIEETEILQGITELPAGFDSVSLMTDKQGELPKVKKNKSKGK